MSPGAAVREVIVIDAGITDWKTLVAGLNPDIAVILLPAGGNGLAALAEALSDYGTLDALHLVSHGAPGRLHLGELRLSSANLAEHAAALAQIASHLGPDADLLLYGCSVAEGDAGKAFAGALSAALNGVDIAASTDTTGALALQGDWDLEYWEGRIDAALPFSDDDIVQFHATLIYDDYYPSPAPPNLQAASDTGTSNTDNLTSLTTITLDGSADPNREIRVYDDGVQIQSTTTNGAGAWSTTLAGLSAGGHSLAVRQGLFGNFGGASGVLQVTIDATAPTLAITSNAATLKTGQTATITFTFSEDPGASFTWNGSVGDVAVSGGTLGAISGSGLTRTATFTPAASTNGGSASITVAAGLYADTAGNNGGAGTTPSLSFDTLAPTLAITSDKAALKAGETAAITFTFSEDPGASFAWNGSSGDIAVSGGTLGAISGTGLTRTATFTPTASTDGGTASITVASGSYTDTAGNNGGAGTTPSLSFDTLAPAAPSTPDLDSGSDHGASSSDNLTSSTTPTFTGTAESGATVTLYDTDGTTVLGTGTATGGNWSIASSTLGEGAHTVTAKATDAAGNPGAASGGLAVTIDTTAPTLAITSSAAALKAGETATITFTFSEDPGSAFTWDGSTGDVVVSGGTLGAISGSGLTRTATFTPAAAANGGSASITVASGSYTDGAGNNGGAGTTPSLGFDTLAPTVAITSDKAVLKAGETATITFTFSEDPGASFAWDGSSGDVAVSGGTLGAISGAGLTRTATFTPTASTNGGTATITVASGSYADAAGNDGGAGTTPALSFDTLDPNAPSTPDLAGGSDSGTSSSDNITSAATPTFTGTAEAGATVNLYDSDGATLLGSGTATGGNWSIASAALGQGAHTITARTVDAAGNTSAASSSLAVTIDTTAPTLAITSGAAALKAGQTATITFTFSEDPGASFSWDGTSGDVAVSGGTLGAISGSGLTRTATFTPAASTNGGSASITVASGLYADAAGNTGGAGITPSLSFDTLAPNAPSAPDLDSGSDDGASSADNLTGIVTPTFTGSAEDGATVTLYDTDGATVLGSATATGGNWSITSTTLANGAHTVSATATDAAGNTSAASAGLAIVVDTPNVAPTGTVTIGGTPTQGMTLTAANTLADADGLGTIAYQWKADGATIAGATASTLVLAEAQVGKAITVSASYLDGLGTTESVDSGATTAVANVNDAPAGTVTISGGAIEGDTLTASNSLSDADGMGTVSYQWKANGGDIAGATAAAFTLAAAQVGTVVTVTASYVDGHGTAEARTSAPTAAVAAFVAPEPEPPVVVVNVDGVAVQTQLTPDPVTGLDELTVTVPAISGTRAEDGTSAHAGLADIPLNVGSAGLVVSLPVGAGLEASGSTSLLNATQGLLDLVDRIGDETAAGSAVQADMDAQAAAFMAGLPAGTLLAVKTLAPSMPAGAGASPAILITGSANAPSTASAVGLVIDASGLAPSTVLQLDNVDFAAVIGAATLRGGSGRNYVIGDDAAQSIVLGPDDDILFGGGGDDTLGSAAGDDRLDGGAGSDTLFGGSGSDRLTGGAGSDVLQGGRSDQGQWNFFLDGQGQVVARHNTLLVDQAATETLTMAELKLPVQMLAFTGAGQDILLNLSLLYEAAFDRAPDLAGLGFWANSGLGAHQLTMDFARSGEWANGLGKLGNADFVKQVYLNALGHAGTAAQQAAALAQLDGAADQAAARLQVFEAIAFGSEHRAAAITPSGMALGGVLVEREQGWIAGDGVDTAVYAGARAQYKLLLTATGELLIADSASGDRDLIRQVEQVQFSDGAADIAFTQLAPEKLQQVGLLYQAVLGRAADLGGIAYWTAQPVSEIGLALGFVDSAEFRTRSGTLDDAAFVRVIQQNALQQAPAEASLQTWTDYLKNHSRAEMVLAYIESAEVVGVQFGTQGLWLA